MAILPARSNLNQSASVVLAELKKGDKEKRNQFVWDNQERIYAIALLATDDAEVAQDLTILAFHSAFTTLNHIVPKQIGMPIWDWLAQFIVEACASYHEQYSQPVSAHSQRIDPTNDGSAQMDWETTVILGTQRVRRCLGSLSQELQKVFMLRHQMSLDYDQIAAVLNESPETVMAWLYRARVQIVKCLGRG
jgi:RNA polymerase sigma factor (sigma-70 family)